MNIIDIGTADRPLNPEEFNVINDFDYPCCILGFQIKSEYDQLRHKIPAKYNAVDLAHFIHYPKITPFFFRGIKIQMTSEFLKVHDDLITKNLHTPNDFDRDTYNNLLQKYNFSATNCSQWLRMGVYPIDAHHINKVSSIPIDLNLLYEEIFNDKEIPYFQSIGYIAIYILDNRNCANGSNAKVLKKIIEDYKKDLDI